MYRSVLLYIKTETCKILTGLSFLKFIITKSFKVNIVLKKLSKYYFLGAIKM